MLSEAVNEFVYANPLANPLAAREATNDPKQEEYAIDAILSELRPLKKPLIMVNRLAAPTNIKS